MLCSASRSQLEGLHEALKRGVKADMNMQAMDLRGMVLRECLGGGTATNSLATQFASAHLRSTRAMLPGDCLLAFAGFDGAQKALKEFDSGELLEGLSQHVEACLDETLQELSDQVRMQGCI